MRENKRKQRKSIVIKGRLCLWTAVVIVLSGSPKTANAAQSTIDHLVPVEKQFEAYGSGAAYKKLYERKLFITPGDIARFVHLPGNVGEEVAVSIHQSTSKKDGKHGGYWMTVTRPSIWLWKCVPRAVEQPIDPETVTIKKCDIALSTSTALSLRKVWLAMLLQTRPDKANLISLDSSAEIFSATNSDGVVLRAKIPNGSLGEKNAALFHIANLLAGYCDVPVSEQTQYAREVDKAASTLLKQLTRK